MKRFWPIGMMVLAAGHEAGAAGPRQAHASGRYEAELMALSARQRSDAAGPVQTLFIGSSSIRLWDVMADFAAYRPINHGFGGATVADVLSNYDLLVTGYDPRTIIVYVGENDIAQGRDPDAVSQDVLAMLARLRADFPAARIMYLSMKYSPARWRLKAAFDRANLSIFSKSAASGGFDYVDVSASLLTEGKDPDVTCFATDGLHLSTIGYQRWRQILDAYLVRPERRIMPLENVGNPREP